MGFSIMRTELLIFDMDGVLIDSSHRYKTVIHDGVEKIDLPYWRANEYRACKDSFLPAFYSHYIPALDNPNCLVVIATARVLNTPDINFLNYHMPRPDFIISRPSGCNTSGGKLKVSGINRLRNLRQFKNISSITVFEDNIQYLKYMCDTLQCNGIYIPSIQGH